MFIGMLEGVKEESVGFLFNVAVEATPAPTVAPVATPQGLAEFAQAAAAGASQEGGQGGLATKERPAPAGLQAKGIDNEPPPMTYSGPSEDGSTEVKRTGGGGGGAGRHAAGGTRKERREAARQQARETKRRG
jgi:preprotein translocase subunit SecA